jgi:hypothetical protein
MIIDLPNVIVPPGTELHIDVGYDNDQEDFFVRSVELGQSPLDITKLDIISPKGISIDILPSKIHTDEKLRIAGTFLTKGSRVSIAVKNPTEKDERLVGYLDGHGIPTSLPLDKETKARLYRLFDECLISAKNIQHYIKQSILL